MRASASPPNDLWEFTSVSDCQAPTRTFPGNYFSLLDQRRSQLLCSRSMVLLSTPTRPLTGDQQWLDRNINVTFPSTTVNPYYPATRHTTSFLTIVGDGLKKQTNSAQGNNRIRTHVLGSRMNETYPGKKATLTVNGTRSSFDFFLPMTSASRQWWNRFRPWRVTEVLKNRVQRRQRGT